MGDTCSMQREIKNLYKILVCKPEETDHSKDLGVDVRKILGWILGKGWEVVDWIHLAQDRDQWRAIVNMVMNLRVP